MRRRAFGAAAPRAKRPRRKTFRDLAVGGVAGLMVAYATSIQADPAFPITPASIRAHHQARGAGHRRSDHRL